MNTKKLTSVLVKCSLVACTLFASACSSKSSSSTTASSSAGSSSAETETSSSSSGQSYSGMLGETVSAIEEYLADAKAQFETADGYMAAVDEAGDVAANVEACKNAAAAFAEGYTALNDASAKCNNAMSFMNVKKYMSKALLAMPTEMTGEDADAVSAFVESYNSFKEAMELVDSTFEETLAGLN